MRSPYAGASEVSGCMRCAVCTFWRLFLCRTAQSVGLPAADERARSRCAPGVERLADPEIIAKFIVNGCMGDAPPGAGGDGGGEPPPTKVSPGGILLI
eukprot:888475-Prymnesium_polylepis.1